MLSVVSNLIVCNNTHTNSIDVFETDLKTSIESKKFNTCNRLSQHMKQKSDKKVIKSTNEDSSFADDEMENS